MPFPPHTSLSPTLTNRNPPSTRPPPTIPMKLFPTILLVLAAPVALAHPAHLDGDPAAEMMAAANTFLATLSPEQKASTVFDFADPERENWHFVPMKRKGIPLAQLAPAQDHLARALLATGLSQRGFLTAASIMSLEKLLADREGNPARRNPDNYYLAVFGTPSTTSTWGWRFEGHHLSLNYTIIDGKRIGVNPSFFGTNPAQVKEGPRKGLRPLGSIEDPARLLATALHAGGKPVVFSGKAPRDVLTGQDRVARKPGDEGVMATDMSDDQKQLLLLTVREFAALGRAEVSGPVLAHITRSVDKLRFAWAGGLKVGDPHYFRIIGGDTFMIEYANTQNDANHAHAVWRLFGNDFGRDVLREHLEKDH